jgi:hypothetical protein
LRARDTATEDLFREDQGSPKVQRIAQWGTPEQLARARSLMLHLGERWGDQYAGHEATTDAEWRQRRSAACWRIFDEALGTGQPKTPKITAEEEKRYRETWTRVYAVGRI